MTLNRTSVFFIGITALLLFFMGGKVILVMQGQLTTGEVIGQPHSGRVTKNNLVRFNHDGFTYSARIYTLYKQPRAIPVTVIFNPKDPLEAYIYNFADYWLLSFLWVAIGLVPLAAASFSFISKNERLRISFRKIGLVKINTADDDY